MRICLSGRIVETWNPRPILRDFLRFAADCGFDGVSLRPWQLPRASSDGELAACKADLAELGLGLGLALVKAQDDLEAALRMGFRVIRCNHPEPFLPGLPEGVRVGPQMHTGGPYETIRSAEEALRAAPPQVGVIVEPGNLVLAGEPFSEDMLLPLRGRLIGCNFQSIETGRGDGSVRLTDGRSVRYARVPAKENRGLPLALFLRALAKAGYDDFISVIEPSDAPETARRMATGAVHALRACLSQPSVC